MRFGISPRRRTDRDSRTCPFVGSLLTFICLISIVPLAVAQGVSGRIVGTIVDKSGAVVSNAKVTITNQDTGITTRIVTNSSGDYRADSLPPGNYQATLEAPGYR